MEYRAGEMNWHDLEYLCLALIKMSSVFSAAAFLPVTWVKVRSAAVSYCSAGMWNLGC